jgi:drug/metabolite transporter (DMT)-like permease
MTFSHRTWAIVALVTAGTLWGLTVPLSKLGLEWLGPGWLTVARFALAAPIVALLARRHLRAALTPGVAAAGALGYGGVILLQNAGIERTSVGHAALVVGAVPVLVAVIAAALGRASGGAAGWAGALIALAGVGLVAGDGGAGATLAGDLLVLASVAGAAGFMVAQPQLLAGRDPGAVTAVQLGSAALFALPVAAVTEGAPPAPAGAVPVAAVLALAIGGTLAAFWLFAWGQAKLPAALASAFVNLEPLVGALSGVVAFGETVGPAQALGGLAILAGIALPALLDSGAPARKDPHGHEHDQPDAARDRRDPRVLPHEPDADLLRLADAVQPARHRPLAPQLLLRQLVRLVRGQPPARVRSEGAAVPRVHVDGGRVQPPARAQGGARPARARRGRRQGGVRHVRRRDREGRGGRRPRDRASLR